MSQTPDILSNNAFSRSFQGDKRLREKNSPTLLRQKQLAQRQLFIEALGGLQPDGTLPEDVVAELSQIRSDREKGINIQPLTPPSLRQQLLDQLT